MEYKLKTNAKLIYINLNINGFILRNRLQVINIDLEKKITLQIILRTRKIDSIAILYIDTIAILHISIYFSNKLR